MLDILGMYAGTLLASLLVFVGFDVVYPIYIKVIAQICWKILDKTRSCL